MAYKVIILYRLYMPSYFLGTFTEYPRRTALTNKQAVSSVGFFLIRSSASFLSERSNPGFDRRR